MADVWTVIWKEYKELLGQGGSLRGGRIGVLLFIGVFGVLLPWQFGPTWIQSPMALAFWAWVPVMLVTTVIADSFAGERERHTLETLLASRLSERSILLGKVGAAVGYGWGLTLIGLALGLVTMSLVHGRGQLLLYPAGMGVAALVLSLLAAGFAAGAGVLISLRASTVRQAQQTLSIAVMLLLFAPVFGLQVLPADLRARLAAWAATIDATTAVVLIATALALLDAGLVALGLARFQRTRLILD